MDAPQMFVPRRVAPDTDMVSAFLPVPGLGVLPANAFVLHAKEPVLVDTGVVALRGPFLDAFSKVIDLTSIRWIWLTHTDPDHVGCLHDLLEAAPRATLVTTYLGMGKLNLSQPIPPQRVYLLNPGQHLDVGDRQLLAVKPPSFDAPETTGAFDPKTRVLFSADCFGAVLTQPAESAKAIPNATLCEGLVTWTCVDAPWLSSVRDDAFARSTAALRDLKPTTVLGSHLPPAAGMMDTLLSYLERARSAPPFVGPDQQAMMRMMQGT